MKRLLDRILKKFSYPPNILVYGGYGFKNIGDEAILAGLLQVIRRCFKKTKITVVSGDPEETTKMHNVTSCYPLSMRMIKEIKNADIVILGGGGIVSRVVAYGSKSKIFFPEGKLIHIVGIFSKLMHKKVLYYGIGATSFSDPLTKMFVILSMRFADVIVTRDELSKKRIKDMFAIKKGIKVEPDLAFDMSITKKERISDILGMEKIDQGKFLIGITWRFIETQHINKAGLETIAHIIDKIGVKYGAKVEFFFIPMSQRWGRIIENDVMVYKEIKKRLKNKYELKVTTKNYRPEDIKGIISVCDFLIGMRFHSIIFAYLTNTPFIGIEYDDKITQFLRSTKKSDKGIKLVQLSEERIMKKICEVIDLTKKSENLQNIKDFYN